MGTLISQILYVLSILFYIKCLHSVLYRYSELRDTFYIVIQNSVKRSISLFRTPWYVLYRYSELRDTFYIVIQNSVTRSISLFRTPWYVLYRYSELRDTFFQLDNLKKRYLLWYSPVRELFRIFSNFLLMRSKIIDRFDFNTTKQRNCTI